MTHRIILTVLVQLTAFSFLFAQAETDTGSSNIYKPYSQRVREMDTTPIDKSESAPDVLVHSDSIANQQYLDSLAAREKFIQDSIVARENFVRDSLLKRKQILDSLKNLKQLLPNLLQASALTMTDDIIIKKEEISIVGDSVLSDFKYVKLINRFNEPYIPWKGKINLNAASTIIEIDTIANLVKSIKASGIGNMFEYSSNRKIIKITRQGLFASKYGKKYYKAPVDSVFLNANNQIVKIKRYYIMYTATDNFKLGAKLFDLLYQVKQFTYSADNSLAAYEVVKFLERWSKTEPEKIVNIANYTIDKQGYKYIVQQQNNPANKFSDGTFTYEFDYQNTLKSGSFQNVGGTENWKTFVEVNEDGNVSRYVYQDKGIVNRTLLINYNNTPGAKHKVETITCTFEDDGISYFQHNNTTNKSRTRDRLTLEWTDWQ